jgi:hypothetical protein
MSRKRLAVLLALILLVAVGVCLAAYFRKTPIERQLERVAVGMSPTEVEAILGPPTAPIDSSALGPGFSAQGWDTVQGTIFVIYESDQMVEKGWVSGRPSPFRSLLEAIESLF